MTTPTPHEELTTQIAAQVRAETGLNEADAQAVGREVAQRFSSAQWLSEPHAAIGTAPLEYLRRHPDERGVKAIKKLLLMVDHGVPE